MEGRKLIFVGQQFTQFLELFSSVDFRLIFLVLFTAHCGSDNVESNNSFGLGNFHFGGSGNNGTLMSNNIHFGNSSGNMGTNSLFGLDACTDSFGNSSGNGTKPEHHHRSPQGSPASGNSGNNGSSEKYQQRVLVAN